MKMPEKERWDFNNIPQEPMTQIYILYTLTINEVNETAQSAPASFFRTVQLLMLVSIVFFKPFHLFFETFWTNTMGKLGIGML